MADSTLSPLQRRIVRVLARLIPQGVLTGGAALAEAYLRHRRTNDVDLFWRARAQLGMLPREAEELLRADGLNSDTIQSGVTFCRLRVRDGSDVCLVDLVADETAAIEPPVAFELEGVAAEKGGHNGLRRARGGRRPLRRAARGIRDAASGYY